MPDNEEELDIDLPLEPVREVNPRVDFLDIALERARRNMGDLIPEPRMPVNFFDNEIEEALIWGKKGISKSIIEDKNPEITEVTLCETKEVCKKEDALYVESIGWFKKDDPRLIKILSLIII
jgi:hypothetical protein